MDTTEISPLLIKFKNGDMIICFIEEETTENYMISSSLNLNFVDRVEYQGLSFSPTIPFDIEQDVSVSKSDILFTAVPSPILEDIYFQRVEEYLNITIDYENNYFNQKRERNKLLH